MAPVRLARLLPWALPLAGVLLACSDGGPTSVGEGLDRSDPPERPGQVGLDRVPGPPAPQTVVLFATPKFVPDFDDPAEAVRGFLEHYDPLVSRAARTVVIFAVGNSEHILQYRGPDYWSDPVSWARYTGFRINPVSDRTMNYEQIAGVVEAFEERAEALGIELAVYDQIDAGREFTETRFKDYRHRECVDSAYEHTFDVRARLVADTFTYASAPDGIEAGTPCGHFLADQVTRYVRDLGFDGILYGNQLGTRGHWLPENGPGWSEEEAEGIRDFLAYSRQALGNLELMWFDSYLPVHEERASFSFPEDGYPYFDYLIASGFCVITFTERYLANLDSKLALGRPPRIVATLDWVDPWYDYDSMIDYPEESARLEAVAFSRRDLIDGLVFFANDADGTLVPRDRIEAFAQRFWNED